MPAPVRNILLSPNIPSFINNQSMTMPSAVLCTICNNDLTNSKNVSRCDTPNCPHVCCLKHRNDLGLRSLPWTCPTCKQKEQQGYQTKQLLKDTNYINNISNQFSPDLKTLGKQLNTAENLLNNKKTASRLIKDIILYIYKDKEFKNEYLQNE